MTSIDLHPDLHTCAQTLARREYDRLWREALGSPDPAPDLDIRVDILRLFLESTDFSALRAAYEPHLTAGETVTVTVSGDGASVHHTIRAE